MPLREVAFVYGALGDRDQAFKYLDRAFEAELASLYFLEVTRWLPHFATILAWTNCSGSSV